MTSMKSTEEEDPLMRMSLTNTTAITPYDTYVAGEDAGRLQVAANRLGLTEARKPKTWITETSQRVAAFFSDSTLTAARMHSVGTLGGDERIDSTGTLHLITIRRRTRRGRNRLAKTSEEQNPDYGTLNDLFHRGSKRAPSKTLVAHLSTTDEGDDEDNDDDVDEGEEVEVEEEEEVVAGGSLGAAVFGIVKGTVGPAILFLPHGFEQSGYGIAVPAMLFATFMFIVCSFRLLECWRVESEKNRLLAERITKALEWLGEDNNGEKNTEEVAPTYTPKLLTYPELARRAFGDYAVLVDIAIASMQFGVCLTYLIFVPQNLQEIVLTVFGYSMPRNYLVILMVLIEVPLAWVQDIRKLTPTNVLATLLIVYGLCFVLVLACQNGFEPYDDFLVSDETYSHADAEIIEEFNTGDSASSWLSSLTFTYNMHHIPLFTDVWFIFVGTSFFMMEGAITLLVPLQEAVFRPEDKKLFPKVNAICTTYIVLFYIAFSLICCAAFGSGVRTALTASLPSNALSTSIQLAYSIAVIFTYPLQGFPALEVTCSFLLSKSDHTLPFWSLSPRNILATLITVGLGLVAVMAINYLGNVVSILGSLFGIPLALVFPPLMHTILVPPKHPFWTRAVNFTIMGAGFFAMAAASFATIVTWNSNAEEG